MSNNNTAPFGIGLSNSVHSDAVSSLPLPSLPVFCGAADPELRLVDELTTTTTTTTSSSGKRSRSLNRSEILDQSSRIAELLRETDVSYLNLRDEAGLVPNDCIEPPELYNQVLQFNSDAFEYVTPGHIKEQVFSSAGSENKPSQLHAPSQHHVPATSQLPQDYGGAYNRQADHDMSASSSKKTKVRKKANDNYSSAVQSDPAEVQDAIIGGFCEVLENFCGRAEVPSDDQDESEWLSLSVADLRKIVNEILSIRMKKLLHRVPVDLLVRLLNVLNHQIHRAEGLSVDECDHADSDIVSSVFTALESIHAILAVMAHENMPKRLYKEEIIERLLDFCRHQIMNVMCAYDPTYRALHRPSERVDVEADEDEDNYAELGSASKRRRTSKGFKVKKSTSNRISTGVSTILQKLCTILGLLKEFLLVERKTSSGNSVLELSIDSGLTTKCHEAVTDTCVLFWTRVLQRLATVKNQEASDLKILMENLVIDLLTTLNLPEYPASAHILEVFVVLLLQNAGLKCKDMSTRSIAIDLLGTIAARLKLDSLICKQETFWILHELGSVSTEGHSFPKDTCCVCFDGRVEKPLVTCQSCQRLSHADCMGVKYLEVPNRDWNCQFCQCRKQLLVLHSFCNTKSKTDGNQNHKRSGKNSEPPDQISKVEIVQQMLLNYLQEAGSIDDMHLFVRWFYLCLWFKDDPKSEEKSMYYLSRMKSKAIVREHGTISLLTRDSVKKITLALGQKNSFSRGFDKILNMLLASLRENSPVIRAKALRAVSIIVEADPEVLGEERVQVAVEGRFCDSAISVREAALELVGRHISSHPDVGSKYFEKVAERIKDTGVSVRKRAIKIIRDMCFSSANFSDFAAACIEIISRVVDDESSIQDLVCKTFYEFWFEEPSGLQTRFMGDGSLVPLEVAKKTEQIVDMLKKMQSHQLLVIVIKRNLALDFFAQSAKAAGINPVQLASVRKRCELMCKCLLERILQVEEVTGSEVEIRALPYVQALHAFCIVDPSLCAPTSNPSQFVVTLQPYLKNQPPSKQDCLPLIIFIWRGKRYLVSKGDSKMIALLLESILFIFDSVLPLLRKLPQSVTEELEQDFKHMIVRHSFLTVVHACIKCLCSLSKLTGKDSTLIMYLIQVFFKHLDSHVADNKQVVGRSLFCLGLLIRYGIALLRQSSYKIIDLAKSVSLFKKYLNNEDFNIKVRSLQALGSILIARPEFMLDKDIGEMLYATLSPNSHVQIKMQALQNMYEYLVDAESQMETEKESENKVQSHVIGDNAVPVAAGAGDTNICGGIIQLYWENILGRCIDFSEPVRQSALKIVEIVLRQGLVHPITCVPYLIALETDPQESNSKLAHHLLMNMNEKHPAFFESRLGDGLQMSFTFMQSMSDSSLEIQTPTKNKVKNTGIKGKSDGVSLNQARLGVSRIYKLIRGNRVSRNKFMSSIVRKFDCPSWSDSAVSFLTYCTEILALLPFTFPDEPLYLVYSINRILQVKAGNTEANMKAFCSQLTQIRTQSASQYNRMVLPEQPSFSSVTMDLNGHPERDNQPSYNHPSLIDLNGAVLQDPVNHTPYNHAPLMETKMQDVNLNESIPVNDLQRVQGDCLQATALQLLFKLKRHLKIVYCLDDARCQAFSPNEPQKPGESLSKQTIPFDISDTRITLPSTYQELIHRYQEFKNALKEDTVDYSTYTANIKKKRPTPRKSKSSARMGARNDDYEDDDDDYSGGPRKFASASGGRRNYTTRGSRLR
ncbi:hypothetical protein ACFE04_008918 [Oxalis oulophora]